MNIFRHLSTRGNTIRRPAFLANIKVCPGTTSNDRCYSSNSGEGAEFGRFLLKRAKGRASTSERDQRGDKVFVPPSTDVVILGGGGVGLSVAYFMKEKLGDSMNVCVVEKDPTYTQASSVLSVGGLRQQFSLKENIQMSLFTLEFLSNLKMFLTVEGLDPPDVHFTPTSYLFLASEDGVDTLKKNHDTQLENNAKVELLDQAATKQRFPWLNVEDIAMASCGIQNEGVFDPWLLLAALKAKCLDIGVIFVNGEVVGFGKTKQDLQSKDEISYVEIKTKNGVVYPCEANKYVNCAGAWAGHVGRLAGIGTGSGLLDVPIPIEPRKRFVYMFHCPDGPGLDMPMMIDNSGVYCRREGLAGHYICGASPPTEFENEPESWFEEAIKPLLQNRIPAFKNSEVKSSWAGYYDYNTLDQNLIIGDHPYYYNFFMASGSSGHGIQHVLPIGRAMTEYILTNRYETIDLSRFSFDRVVHDQPIYETNIV